jgi:hypothetical protein
MQPICATGTDPLVLCIRVRIRMDSHLFWSAGSGFGFSWGMRIRIQDGKKLTTNLENSEEISCFEVLDVPFRGLLL